MLTRATYVVPTAAVLVTAVVLLGPGSAKPALGARVLGAAVEGTHVIALRVETTRSLYGVEDGANGLPLRVTASNGADAIGAWEGASGSDGIAEAIITSTSPIHGPLRFRVESPSARGALAETEIALPHAVAVFSQLATIRGHTEGNVVLRVDAVRGVLAAPFAERLRVSATTSEGAPVAAHLTLHANMAELTPAEIDTDTTGRAIVSLKPLAHQVELTIEAKGPGEDAGKWTSELPIVPGAEWLDAEPAGDSVKLTVVSPVPRDRAYVSIWSEEGRVGGVVVPLERDASGFFRGEARPAVPVAGILFASVAGDPRERGAATVAWPIRPPEGAVTARPLQLLADGVPAAVERERRRAWAARRAAMYMVAASGVLEILLLVLRARLSQRKLDAHLKRALSEGDAPIEGVDREKIIASGRESTWLRGLIMVAIVGLAFAMMAAVASFR